MPRKKIYSCFLFHPPLKLKTGMIIQNLPSLSFAVTCSRIRSSSTGKIISSKSTSEQNNQKLLGINGDLKGKDNEQ